MKQKWTQMMILGGLTAVVVMGTGCKRDTRQHFKGSS